MGLFNAKKTKPKKTKLNKSEIQREEVLTKIRSGDLSDLRSYGHDKEIVLEAIRNSTEDISGDIAIFLQNSDEEVVSAFLDRGWLKPWSYYDETIQNNPYILEKYLNQGGILNEAEVNESFFLNDKTFALLAFKNPGVKEDLRERIIERFNDDFDVALEGVSTSGKYYTLLSDALKNQYGILASAVKTYPGAIFSANKMWLSDVRIVKILFRIVLEKLQVDTNFTIKSALSILLYVGDFAKDPEIIQLRKNIIIQIISKQPDTIIHFGSIIQNDPQILTVFLNYGGDYRKLSYLRVETLNNNMRLALEFIKKGGRDIFEDLDLSLRNNPQIAYEAIQIDKSCIHLVTDEFTLAFLLKKDDSLRQIMDSEVFKRVDAFILNEDREDFYAKIKENAFIQKKQQEQLSRLQTAITNEQVYQRNRDVLTRQEQLILEQKEEIENLKRQLAELTGKAMEDEPQEKGKAL